MPAQASLSVDAIGRVLYARGGWTVCGLDAVQVHGATLERANMDVTRGLVEMIRLQRAYEVQLEAMKQRDALTRTTIGEVGQVGR